ncbi:DEAD/DEAH box helicase [Luteimicrobium xylanilyticum]|uniref:DEAD/DEAH box helicase n=1 Tax=Luteimicrobium xylanilyticum TaxID=1133546 RepID=A0A5P9QBQ9_9MICO|nr:DEAD/DEAH box helicase [Luteimicrobium xylanilyticum]QFU98512.1 hypothetical protein KDY119_02028 [Luteimicrobium xylanilyticum]
MDAFKVHRNLIDDYRRFTEGFVEILDPRIRASVAEQTAGGAQWPDPWLSLNPSFQVGGSVDDLVSAGTLHPGAAEIFRVGKDMKPPAPKPIVFHQHQKDAIEAATEGDSYVLTTGTGSGKSLAYIVPIVDHVLRRGSGRGVQAIVVYPMNALANSQQEELSKFLRDGFGEGNEPVTFARYTGQESPDERAAILANPPDILLTNYVMLEYVLVRPKERDGLVTAAQGLKFLVLDELHTYRGRQGADVAMLVRRVREATGAGDALQCVGTSATMSTAETVAEQRREVAEVATRIFGSEVVPERVITETLERATVDRAQARADLMAAVDARGEAEAFDPALTGGYERLANDALAAWIEDAFGLSAEPGTGILVRTPPVTVEGVARDLARVTARDPKTCETAIRATLLAGSRAQDKRTGRPLFAFRLHQFISKGASVYVTAEAESDREIVHDYQIYAPGAETERRLYPLAFCRECGQEYLMARYDTKKGIFTARTRIALEPNGDDERDGYLFVDTTDPWPSDPIDRLPDSWLEETGSGTRVRKARRDRVPRPFLVGPDGTATPLPGGSPARGVQASWIAGGLMFCLRCGVSYNQPRTSEISKVAALDVEGRSSAMTVLSTSIIRSLDAEKDLPDQVRKLLTFVDNRQDASLQAGHVNDFALVGQLRAALYAAAKNAGDDGLDPLELGNTLPGYLNLAKKHYAQSPDGFDTSQADAALRRVVGFRAMQDLKRGWRVTLPNLEQTGLVRVHYPIARRLCEAEDYWAGAHPLLRPLDSEQRYELVEVLLDEFRRVLALDTDVFSQENVERLQALSREHLTGIWAVGDRESIPYLGIATLLPQGQGSPRNALSLTAKGSYGRWLKSKVAPGMPLSDVETTDVLTSLVTLLAQNGMLTEARERDLHGYRLKVHQIRLFKSDGKHGAPDPVRRNHAPEQAPRVVPFFRDLYRDAGRQLAGLVAREHTAQVRAEIRQEREKQFRTGELKLLYCSPTMELGVDIASLNTVAMRNVPPTPANYAQRSGRAGRSGQPAVVVTYCASGNAHDSYYFARSDQMVAGRVLPPRLDLANEDLVRSHVHSIWLACTHATLGTSMKEVVDVGQPGYPLRPGLKASFSDSDFLSRALAAARVVLKPLEHELVESPWWSTGWLDDVIAMAPDEFDRACDRWRTLDQTVRQEMDTAYQQMTDVSLLKKDRQNAEMRQREASRQRDLLLNESDTFGQGDYYPYRYFASEGFLPGYSFPRLPLAAYVPGVRGAGATWLQRPRFLALREFGPNALVYHEGARYQVTRVNLPRDPHGDAVSTGNAGSVTLSSVRICLSCSYHHERQVGMDVCENCGAPLSEVLNNLMLMQTVVTQRRDRISADEEERQRLGFAMVTTYRFRPRGTAPASLYAQAVEAGVPVLDLRYGDAAELRVTNTGPRKRAPGTTPGFWIDTVKGKWLSDKRAAELDQPEADDDGESLLAEDVERKARVVPYVEDRRNIAVVRWSERVEDNEAVTLMYAIERGIEATYQLEDSELTSEILSDGGKQGRFLLVEASEGGAGVLRRLHADRDALSDVARKALEIIHVDPDTGIERADACVAGCYRCLLTYGNQTDHESIDRRLAVVTLRRLFRATTVADQVPDDRPLGDGVGPSPVEGRVRQTFAPYSGRAAELLELLGQRNLRLPTAVDEEVEGLVVDLYFRDQNTVVVFDVEGEDPLDTSPLVFGGTHVLQVPPDADLGKIIDDNPSTFGSDD